MARYRTEGHPGLQDRSSRPHTTTGQLDPYLIVRIEELRRDREWSARRIHHHLRAEGHQLHLRTVGRWLHRLGISRLRDLTPAGEQLRRSPQRIRTSRPGQIVHLDVKKLGRIPDGGGRWAHGRGSQAALSSKRQGRVGYTYMHSAIDGHTRLAYTEALPDEKARTTIGFFARARVFFAAHGITELDRVVTDNGNNYRAADFTRAVQSLAGRHQRVRPYTPRHNGKAERYNRLMVDEVLYARAYDSEPARRQAVKVWVNHYSYHRPHTACGYQPPASRTPARVNNVMPSYI